MTSRCLLGVVSTGLVWAVTEEPGPIEAAASAAKVSAVRNSFGVSIVVISCMGWLRMQPNDLTGRGEREMKTAGLRASLADIKPGMFIGSAAMPQADGSQKSLEVHIFPEAMRGTGEGHRPYTIPNSTMTNGTVGNAVAGVDGNVVTLKYKDGEKKMIVSPGIPIVRYEIGDRGDLKPGAAFTILSAVKKADGSLETNRVNVG